MEDNTRQCTLCKKVLNSSSDYHMRRHQEGSDCKQPQQRLLGEEWDVAQPPSNL